MAQLRCVWEAIDIGRPLKGADVFFLPGTIMRKALMPLWTGNIHCPKLAELCSTIPAADGASGSKPVSATLYRKKFNSNTSRICFRENLIAECFFWFFILLHSATLQPIPSPIDLKRLQIPPKSSDLLEGIPQRIAPSHNLCSKLGASWVAMLFFLLGRIPSCLQCQLRCARFSADCLADPCTTSTR